MTVTAVSASAAAGTQTRISYNLRSNATSGSGANNGTHKADGGPRGSGGPPPGGGPGGPPPAGGSGGGGPSPDKVDTALSAVADKLGISEEELLEELKEDSDSTSSTDSGLLAVAKRHDSTIDADSLKKIIVDALDAADTTSSTSSTSSSGATGASSTSLPSSDSTDNEKLAEQIMNGPPKPPQLDQFMAAHFNQGTAGTTSSVTQQQAATLYAQFSMV